MVYLIYNMYKQHSSYHYELRNDQLEEISFNVDTKNWAIGDFVDIEGSGKNKVINKVKVPNNFFDFYPKSKKHPDQLKSELLTYIKQINEPNYQILLEQLVVNNELFYTYPAAKKIHHAYIGGLCEHTLNMLALSDGYIKQYNLDRDLLYTAIIFHDYGKIYEYANYGLTYSDEGSLLGHIVISDEHISICANHFNLDKQPILMLKHLVLSHHGELSYGSPKPPMCKEAVVLHVLDDTDAQINMIDQALEGVGANQFSSPISLLDRRKFINLKQED